MELRMNHLPSRIILQKDYSFKWQLCTKVCPFLQGWSPNFRYIKAIYKDAVPDISYSNQNTETSCKSKLKLLELKDLYIKSSEKLAKDNYSKTLIFSGRYHFRLRVFTSNSQCFSCWHSGALFKALQVKWCQGPLKHLS